MDSNGTSGNLELNYSFPLMIIGFPPQKTSSSETNYEVSGFRDANMAEFALSIRTKLPHQLSM